MSGRIPSIINAPVWKLKPNQIRLNHVKLKTFSFVAVNFYFPATTIPSIISVGEFVE